jgi:hypothetical protein
VTSSEKSFDLQQTKGFDIGSDYVPGHKGIDCGHFHLASCQYPLGNFENLPEEASWCYSCKAWMPKQGEMSNPGADM